jgi:hypothetical protein
VLCYITDVKTGPPGSTLVLLAIAAFCMAGGAGQSQAPTHKAATTASQDQAKTSTKTSPIARERKIPCKTPDNATLCYWTHGRLSYYSVTFTWLFWEIGTHRLLKICDEPTYLSMQSTGDCGDPEFPANLESIYDADERRWKRGGGHGEYSPPDVFGDFEICPLEPERKGERQYACIESTKITFVQK